MNIRRLSVPMVLGMLVCLPAACRAIGADLPKDELERKGQIVPGLKPVHGYFVNWEDVYFYSGEARSFNRFMEAYARLRHVQLKVVLHRGEGAAASPWDKESRGPADWSLYVWLTGYPLQGDDSRVAPPGKPAPTRVDVWVGRRLRLADLRIPAGLEVAAAGKAESEDAEIKRYLAGRKEERRGGSPP